MIPSAYTYLERIPSADEHRALWEAVGWGALDARMAVASLANTLHGVVVYHGEQLVGMGRMVGDGAMYFYIQDVAVLPEHQRQGIGRGILERLIRYAQSRRSPEGLAFTGLFAAEGTEAFYEAFGFRNHAPGMTGMFTVYE